MRKRRPPVGDPLYRCCIPSQIEVPLPKVVAAVVVGAGFAVVGLVAIVVDVDVAAAVIVEVVAIVVVAIVAAVVVVVVVVVAVAVVVVVAVAVVVVVVVAAFLVLLCELTNNTIAKSAKSAL